MVEVQGNTCIGRLATVLDMKNLRECENMMKRIKDERPQEGSRMAEN